METFPPLSTLVVGSARRGIRQYYFPANSSSSRNSTQWVDPSLPSYPPSEVAPVSSLFGRRGCQEGDRGGGGEDFIRGDGTEGFLSLSAAHSCKVVHTFFFPFHGNREGYRDVVPARTLKLFVLLNTVSYRTFSSSNTTTS